MKSRARFAVCDHGARALNTAAEIGRHSAQIDGSTGIQGDDIVCRTGVAIEYVMNDGETRCGIRRGERTERLARDSVVGRLDGIGAVSRRRSIRPRESDLQC